MSTICALSSLCHAHWGRPSSPAWRHPLSNLLGYLVFRLWAAFGQRLQAVGTGTERVHFLAVSPNSTHQKFLLFLVPVLAVNFTTICSSISKTISVLNIFLVSVIHQNAPEIPVFQYTNYIYQTTSCTGMKYKN